METLREIARTDITARTPHDESIAKPGDQRAPTRILHLRGRLRHHPRRQEVERVQNARPHDPRRKALVRLRLCLRVIDMATVAVRWRGESADGTGLHHQP